MEIICFTIAEHPALTSSNQTHSNCMHHYSDLVETDSTYTCRHTGHFIVHGTDIQSVLQASDANEAIELLIFTTPATDSPDSRKNLKAPM